jgi:hypothetical protein
MSLWLRVAAIVLLLGTAARADSVDWSQYIDRGGPPPKNTGLQLAGTSAPAKAAPAKAAPKREARSTKAKTSKGKAKRTVKTKPKRR